MQDTFSNVGILFIYDKRMVSQKKITMVSKRLQEVRPHQCRIYSVADVAYYAAGPVLLGAPRFYLDFFYLRKQN